MIRSLAVLATTPSEINGPFLSLAHSLGNNNFGVTMNVVCGRIDPEPIRGHCLADGVVDTIKFLLNSTCSHSRKTLRLMAVTNDG